VFHTAGGLECSVSWCRNGILLSCRYWTVLDCVGQ
jgi:hypothetical protein